MTTGCAVVRLSLSQRGRRRRLPLTSILCPQAGEADWDNAMAIHRSLCDRPRSQEDGNAMTKSRTLVRLSLSQRERIKVRDCSDSVLPASTKLPEGRCPALPGPDDSRTEGRKFLGWSEIRFALGRAFREGDNRGLHRPTRQPVSPPDNRNPRCKDQRDAAAGICNDQSFDFEDGAKGCVRSRLRFCGDNWGGTLRDCLVGAILSEKGNRLPLTSILSPRPGRGGLQQA
jgi:hypothetical protein